MISAASSRCLSWRQATRNRVSGRCWATLAAARSITGKLRVNSWVRESREQDREDRAALVLLFVEEGDIERAIF